MRDFKIKGTLMLKNSSMFCYIFLYLLSSVFQFAKANPNQVLKNGKLSYYGEKFYASKKITKDDLYQILIQKHMPKVDDYDQIITSNTCSSNCYQHIKNDYQRAREILFGDLFKQQDNRGTFVQEVYCSKKFYFKNVSEISNMGDQVNIEHTWPQSKFSTKFDKFLQKGDLHHLFPSDSHANSTRGNYNFGDASTSSYQGDVDDCPESRVQDIAGRIEFTPPKFHKGNTARALFYFSVRYNLNIGPAEEMILRLWHFLIR